MPTASIELCRAIRAPGLSHHASVCVACPWAQAPRDPPLYIAPLSVQGLQDVIGLSVTHPTWQPTRPGQDEHTGWAFAAPGDPPLASPTGHGSFPCDGCIPDSGWWASAEGRRSVALVGCGEALGSRQRCAALTSPACMQVHTFSTATGHRRSSAFARAGNAPACHAAARPHERTRRLLAHMHAPAAFCLPAPQSTAPSLCVTFTTRPVTPLVSRPACTARPILTASNCNQEHPVLLPAQLSFKPCSSADLAALFLLSQASTPCRCCGTRRREPS